MPDAIASPFQAPSHLVPLPLGQRLQVQLEPIRQIGDAALVKPKYTGFRQALVTIFKEEGIQVRQGGAPWSCSPGGSDIGIEPGRGFRRPRGEQRGLEEVC